MNALVAIFVLMVLSLVASLVVWSILRVGARADAVNEAYAEQLLQEDDRQGEIR